MLSEYMVSRTCYEKSIFIDYDGDDHLGHDDLSKMIRSLTRDELTDEEVEFIIERVSSVFLFENLDDSDNRGGRPGW